MRFQIRSVELGKGAGYRFGQAIESMTEVGKSHRDTIPHRYRCGRRRGMTLIEVMVGAVLTAILVTGLTSLWVSVDNGFNYLTVRQKAIFVLNGEMERLTALYRYTDFSDTVAVNYPSGEDEFADQANNARTIYGNPNDGLLVDTIVETDGTTTGFDCLTANNVIDTTCAGDVFFDDQVNNSLDRNFVWIDQARNIVGKLSWELDDIGVNDPGGVGGTTDLFNGNYAGGTCFSRGAVADCQLLTLYLQFPYRYFNASTPDGKAGFGKLETLTLMTVVAAR